MQFSRIKTLLHNKVTLFLCCCCVALASCEDPNELGLGLVDDNISGNYTDTLTVNVSTVYLDSLVTSGTGTMLVGQYTAPYSGTLMSNTFFQVGLGSSSWALAEDATYDSLRLLMPYSGYSYGDTTQAATFDIHRVTGTLAARTLSPYFFNEEPLSSLYADNALYNVSNTGTAPDALGSFTITPRPAGKDTLAIALSDELGQEWLSLKKAADTRLTDANNFLDYFHGLNVTSTAGNAVVGFSAAPTVIRLYYTETVNGTRTSRTRDFPLINTALQYNQIQTNLEGTELEAIVRGGQPLPASQTSNVSVAQAGSGLMIKLDFPYLTSLKEQVPAQLINRAILVIEPLNNTIQYPYPVPATLGLYTTNSSNVPLAPRSTINASTGTAVALSAAYEEPSQQNVNGRYTFNLTSDLVSLLSQDNPDRLSLLLAPSAAAYTSGVSRLVVGNPEGQQSIKLKIYYTTIK